MVWTYSNISPYTINLSTETLSKETEVDPRDYYSRSIALLDSSENYIELKIHSIGFKFNNGRVQRIDYSRGELGSLVLTPFNAIDSLGVTTLNVIPENVSELLLDYSIEGKNINNIANILDNNLQVSFNILDFRNLLLYSKTNNYSTNTGFVNLVREEISIPVNSFTYTPLVTNISASVKIKNLTPRAGAFASLGHIFDYTKLAPENLKQPEELKVITKVERLDVQNYPNPFNPITNFEVKVAEDGFVSLKVFDVLGREVAVLFNEEKPAGIYKISFNASSFPSGVYFYRLESKNRFLTKKMLLLK